MTDVAIDAAFDAIDEVHRLMSFHEPHSDVSRLNQDACIRPTRVDPWTFQVLETATELYRLTDRVFDVTIAPALQAMGLLPRLRGDPVLSRNARFADAIELLPGNMVRFRSAGVTIDLGGIAKGFAVDRAVDVLCGLGIATGMVNAGGDLRVFGEPRMIHLRDPRDPGRSLCRIDVVDDALASTALRFDLIDGVRSGHSAVIEPSTHRPAGSIDGVTVRAPSCMIADALTKVVMISASDSGGLLEHYKASALLIGTDGDLQITSDWHHAVHLAA
ncbi:FAD:protein FMN transferase [Bradyrhizobium sp. WYCCWR 13023]|uniref:FAD:protein FMN transferase n=1 Tax=Bradyrhizobium zhengyangense TaxID=2911009 RepID=A0A9X1UJW6_9BRAD|nr:FAD:protein FMN transferase [Bradyrhizobium zhengyangense]